MLEFSVNTVDYEEVAFLGPDNQTPISGESGVVSRGSCGGRQIAKFPTGEFVTAIGVSRPQQFIAPRYYRSDICVSPLPGAHLES
jgi:hypothetical protein